MTITDVTRGLAEIVLHAIQALDLEGGVDPDVHPWHNRQPADLAEAADMDDLEGCPPRVEFYIQGAGGFVKGALRRLDQCNDIGVDLRIRYRTCWPVPDNPAVPSPDELAAGEATAGDLQRVVWAGTSALARELCTPTIAATRGAVHVGIASPLPNLGGSTGWEWPITFRPRMAAPALAPPPGPEVPPP